MISKRQSHEFAIRILKVIYVYTKAKLKRPPSVRYQYNRGHELFTDFSIDALHTFCERLCWTGSIGFHDSSISRPNQVHTKKISSDNNLHVEQSSLIWVLLLVSPFQVGCEHHEDNALSNESIGGAVAEDSPREEEDSGVIFIVGMCIIIAVFFIGGIMALKRKRNVTSEAIIASNQDTAIMNGTGDVELETLGDNENNSDTEVNIESNVEAVDDIEGSPVKKKRGRPPKKESERVQTRCCRKKACKKCKLCPQHTCECNKNGGSRTQNKGKYKKRDTSNPRPPLMPTRTALPRISTKSRNCDEYSPNIPLFTTPNKYSGQKSIDKDLTPRTMAHKVIRGEIKSSTPVAIGLAASVLRQSDPQGFLAMYDINTEESLPNFNNAIQKTSLEQSQESTFKTFGDAVSFFGRDKENTRKVSGSATERATNSNFATDHPIVMKALVAVVQDAATQVATVALPADPSGLLDMAFPNGNDCNRLDDLSLRMGEKLHKLYHLTPQKSGTRKTVGAVIEYLSPDINIQKMPKKSKKVRKTTLTQMLNGQKIEEVIHRRQRTETEVIQSAVGFILSSDNAQTLSWGTHEVKLGQEVITLPNTVRKKPLSQLWEEYYSAFYDENKKSNSIGRTSFLSLAKEVTYSDPKSIACVDYVLGNLCSDPTETLQKIIDEYFNGVEKEELTRNLELVRNFLKVQFDQHVKKDDGDGFHSLGHALSKENKASNKCRHLECTVCSTSPDSSTLAYQVKDRVIYTDIEKKEHIVEVTQCFQDTIASPNIQSYSVKFIDGNTNEVVVRVYYHQLRKIPIVQVQCNACKFPFWFCHNLERRVKDIGDRMREQVEIGTSTQSTEEDAELQVEIGTSTHSTEEDAESHNSNSTCLPRKDYRDAMKVIRDCREKFFFFLRHRARVICQRIYSDNLDEQLKDECQSTRSTSRALIIIDWKMKFEPMSTRETMPENFGKRGLGWHGAAILYYEWDKEENKPIKKVMYIDQIVDKSNRQDSIAVISLIEAMVVAITINLPTIKEGIICSDNAGCYASKLLVAMIPMLNAKNRGSFFISRLMHTETQDGKGLVDGHFAVGMRHLKKYMSNAMTNRIIRINTSPGLARALQWKNGMANSIVQLVEFDRDHTEKLANRLEKLVNQMKKYLSRASDIEFVYPEELLELGNGDFDDIISKLNGLKASIVLLAHSMYGQSIGVTLDFAENTVVLDENGLREYHLALGEIQDIARVDEFDDDDDDDDDYVPDDDDVISCDSAFDNCSPDQSGLEWERESVEFENASDEDESIDNSSSLNGDACISEELENADWYEHVNIIDPRPYCEPKEKEYQHDEMCTRLNVAKASYLVRKPLSTGTVGRRRKMSKKSRTNKNKDHTVIPPLLRKDVLAVGVRLAAEYIENGRAIIIDAHKDQPDIYAVANNFCLLPTELPAPGFARRDDGGGDLFGARYIGPFKPLVQSFVKKGNDDKAFKCSPAQISDEIQKANPTLFSLPTTYEIQCYINQVLQKKTSKEGNTEEDEIANEIDPKESEELAMKSWLRERLRRDIHAKPERIYQELTLEFPTILVGDINEVKKLTKRKISSMKAYLKGNAYKHII